LLGYQAQEPLFALGTTSLALPCVHAVGLSIGRTNVAEAAGAASTPAAGCKLLHEWRTDC
jgi:hypothetical protein